MRSYEFTPCSLQSYLNVSLFQQSIVTIGRRENNFDTIHVTFRSIAFVQQHTKCNRSVHVSHTRLFTKKRDIWNEWRSYRSVWRPIDRSKDSPRLRFHRREIVSGKREVRASLHRCTNPSDKRRIWMERSNRSRHPWCLVDKRHLLNHGLFARFENMIGENPRHGHFNGELEATSRVRRSREDNRRNSPESFFPSLVRDRTLGTRVDLDQHIASMSLSWGAENDFKRTNDQRQKFHTIKVEQIVPEERLFMELLDDGQMIVI